MKGRDLGILLVKIVLLAVLLMIVNGIGSRFLPAAETDGARGGILRHVRAVLSSGAGQRHLSALRGRRHCQNHQPPGRCQLRCSPGGFRPRLRLGAERLHPVSQRRARAAAHLPGVGQAHATLSITETGDARPADSFSSAKPLS